MGEPEGELRRSRLFATPGGGIWQAGASSGLTVAAEGETPVPVELPQRGQAYAVNELFEDNEGNVWVASPINGLVRVRRPRVEVLDANEEQNERAVLALLEDHSGSWSWIPRIAVSKLLVFAVASSPKPSGRKPPRTASPPRSAIGSTTCT